MKIKVRRASYDDTCSPDYKVTKEELLSNVKSHILNVTDAMYWMADELRKASIMHDRTKLRSFKEFYTDFVSVKPGDSEAFKKKTWFQDIHLSERHHLSDRVPSDVNLIDVMEKIADVVMAGLARSGEVYDDAIDVKLLMTAYKNTIDQLKEQVEVKGEVKFDNEVHSHEVRFIEGEEDIEEDDEEDDEDDDDEGIERISE